MTVGELIQKLRAFDPDLLVCRWDNEYESIAASSPEVFTTCVWVWDEADRPYPSGTEAVHL